jgi:PPOX class probable F420-dependent enzyme
MRAGALVERISRAGDRLFDRMRDTRAFAITEDGAQDGDLSSVRGSEYAVLVTFRRTGEPVPSPVWLAVDENGRGYLRTASASGKVKRLRRDSRVLVAPATWRGRPLGPAVRGTARLLTGRDDHAEATLSAAYGIGRKVYERLVGGSEHAYLYVEVTAGR